MNYCTYCGSTVDYNGCSWGCDEECACGLTVGECGPDPCEAQVQRDREIIAGLRECGRKMLAEREAEEMARGMAVGG